MTNKTKNAFTLAEVLITLVIVGIVATLTISSVINTYVERATVSKVKKGLSILAQAKKLAETQNGPIEGWDFGEGFTAETARDFWKYIKPYFSLAKDCGAGTGCYQNNGTYYLNGTYNKNYNTFEHVHNFILADGSVMWFRTGGSTSEGKCPVLSSVADRGCALFWYDVNGDKKPNAFGRDIFVYIVGVDSVFPLNKDDCNKNGEGWGCAGYIITHNNMNYLH